MAGMTTRVASGTPDRSAHGGDEVGSSSADFRAGRSCLATAAVTCFEGVAAMSPYRVAVARRFGFGFCAGRAAAAFARTTGARGATRPGATAFATGTSFAGAPFTGAPLAPFT